MDLPDWVPDGVEVTVPNAARMYDYALGGYHNFAVDREFVEKAEHMMPGAIAMGHANRAFVGRSVRWLVGQGIRQFLDIGSGIPTLGNVHEVAQAAAPECRVMYVDLDPVAVAHSKAILTGNARADIIQADMRVPADIFSHEDVVRLLDFSRPVAVLLNAVLHFVPDSDDPAGIVSALQDVMVSGSYIVMTHGTEVPSRLTEAENVRELYRSTPTSIHLRTPEQVLDYLSGLEIVEPGIVEVGDWHPDPDVTDEEKPPGILAVVGRKP